MNSIVSLTCALLLNGCATIAPLPEASTTHRIEPTASEAVACFARKAAASLDSTYFIAIAGGALAINPEHANIATNPLPTRLSTVGAQIVAALGPSIIGQVIDDPRLPRAQNDTTATLRLDITSWEPQRECASRILDLGIARRLGLDFSQTTASCASDIRLSATLLDRQNRIVPGASSRVVMSMASREGQEEWGISVSSASLGHKLTRRNLPSVGAAIEEGLGLVIIQVLGAALKIDGSDECLGTSPSANTRPSDSGGPRRGDAIPAAGSSSTRSPAGQVSRAVQSPSTKVHVELALTMRGHAAGVRSVAISQDGRLVVSGDDAGMVRIWDARTGTVLRAFRAHEGAVTSISIAPDGRSFVTTGKEGRVTRFSFPTVDLVWTMLAHHGIVYASRFASAGDKVFVGNADGRVAVLDAATGRVVLHLGGHAAAVGALAVSPSGAIATGSADRSIILWTRQEAHHGKLTGARLTGHAAGVRSLDFVGADLIVSAGHDNTVRVWSTASRSTVSLFRLPSGSVPMAVVAVAGGRMLAVGGQSSTLAFWNLQSREPASIHEDHSGPINALATAGSLVVSGSSDRSIRVWRVRVGQ